MNVYKEAIKHHKEYSRKLARHLYATEQITKEWYDKYMEYFKSDGDGE